MAMIGLLISGYLLNAYVSGGPIICTGNAACEIVRSSAYASLFGIPTPAFGVFFYAVLAILALLWRTPHVTFILQVWTAGGVLVSLWLSYIEAFVIEAWCMWCVLSAIVSVVAFILVWYKVCTLWLSQRKTKFSPES